jgi:hypothetical protein
MVRNYQTHTYVQFPRYVFAALREICTAERELAISLYRVTQRTAALAVLASIYKCFVRFHELER